MKHPASPPWSSSYVYFSEFLPAERAPVLLVEAPTFVGCSAPPFETSEARFGHQGWPGSSGAPSGYSSASLKDYATSGSEIEPTRGSVFGAFGASRALIQCPGSWARLSIATPSHWECPAEQISYLSNSHSRHQNVTLVYSLYKWVLSNSGGQAHQLSFLDPSGHTESATSARKIIFLHRKHALLQLDSI